ncbi:uncharacterized protein LOC142528452 [Primulina tabacum]|uniref:uncharacterized protein LOC142528452 n=1 Tax=Primulina tabacum TaxID=48773 RepID=UPI003F598392
MGTVEIVTSKLRLWFQEPKGMPKAYDYFVKAKGKCPWSKLLCRGCILPKHRILMWLIAHRKLLTRDRLGFVEDRMCLLCKEVGESNEHLFFKCRITKLIWNEIRHWLGMKKIMGRLRPSSKLFTETYRGNSTANRMRATALATTIYHVWNMCN